MTAPVTHTGALATTLALAAHLQRTLRWAGGPEAGLQAATLAALGRLPRHDAVTREARLGPADRIDFLVGAIGVECKVEGATAAVARQLARYAAAREVVGLVLVTNRRRHATQLPATIGGKPLAVVVVRTFP